VWHFRQKIFILNLADFLITIRNLSGHCDGFLFLPTDLVGEIERCMYLCDVVVTLKRPNDGSAFEFTDSKRDNRHSEKSLLWES
jgi:hypothetical protein